MKTRHIIAASIIFALLVASAGASIYYVLRDDLPAFSAPSYTTIVPTDSPLRNTPGAYGGCDFSPNNCVGAIPEPGTYALFGLGLVLMMMFKRGRV